MSNILDRIISNVSSVNAQTMRRDATRNKLSGAAAVARGESLQEVEQNTPLLEQMFGGGATMQGANEQYMKQGINGFTTDVANNMTELRTQSPEAFQQRAVGFFDSMMTGDPDVDNAITLNAKQAIATTTKLHQKSHLAYVQEQHLISYTASVNSAYMAQEAIHNTEGADASDIAGANESVFNALQRPDGMDAGAYEESLISFAEVRAAEGDSSLADRIIAEGSVSPESHIKLLTAQQKAWKATQRDNAIMMNKEIAALVDYSNTDNAELSQMITMAGTIEEAFGPDAIGSRLISIFTKKIGKGIKEHTDQMVLNAYLTGGGITGLDKAQSQKGYQLHDLLLKKQVESGIKDPLAAQEELMHYWKNNDAVDIQRTREWTTVASNPLITSVDGKGQPNSAYVQLLTTSAPWFEAHPEKATAMLGSGVNVQRFFAIQNAMKQGGIDAEQAIVQWADPDRLATAEEYAKYGMREDMTEVTEMIEDGDADMWLIPDDHWEAMQVTPHMNSMLKQIGRELVAQSQSTEELPAAIMSVFRKRAEQINGQWVMNGGKSLKQRMGTTADASTVLTHYLEEHAEEMFIGYNPDTITIRVDPINDAISFYTKDVNGFEQAPAGTNFGRQFPLGKFGDLYEAEVEDEQARDNQARAERQIDAQVNQLKWSDHKKGRDRTDEERREEVRQRNQVEEVSSTILREFSNNVRDTDFWIPTTIKEMEKWKAPTDDQLARMLSEQMNSLRPMN